jgi:hypothetical protein
MWYVKLWYVFSNYCSLLTFKFFFYYIDMRNDDKRTPHMITCGMLICGMFFSYYHSLLTFLKIFYYLDMWNEDVDHYEGETRSL